MITHSPHFDTLYSAIIKNKKYRAIAPSVVTEAIERYFARYPSHKTYLERPQSEKFKTVAKAIRGELHRVHGTFQTTKKHMQASSLQSLQKILSRHQITSPASLRIHENILATHRSTQERLPYYPSLYQTIFARTGKPTRILDLGCGLNPFSYPFMQLETVYYFCFDIDQEDISFLNAYFPLASISGKATVLDLRKEPLWKELPAADIAFLFNILDPLEHGKKGHKLSELLLKHIPAPFLIVSFSLHTLSGKKMNYPQRGWIERMLTRVHYSFTSFETLNELFYIIHKPATN